MNSTECFCFGVFCGLVLGVLIAIGVHDSWRTDSVKRGHAEYSQTTGKWQWKEVK